MLETTVDAVKAIIRADPTISARERAVLLDIIRNGPKTLERESAEITDRIVRRREVATSFGATVRTVDRLAAAGVIRKVKIPGRRRSVGFLLSDVRAFLAGLETTQPRENPCNQDHETQPKPKGGNAICTI